MGWNPESLMPHSQPVERACLREIILREDAITEATNLKPEDFYFGDHQAMFAAALDLFREGHTVDLVSLPEQLGDTPPGDWYARCLEVSGDFQQMGVMGFFVNRIKSLAKARRLIETCYEAIDVAHSNGEEAADLIQSALLGLEGHQQGEETIHELKAKAIELFKQRLSGDFSNRTRTGFHKLDQILFGLGGGEMTILAARPSVGKSTLALNFAGNICKQQPVLVHSLEMPGEMVVQKMLIAEARNGVSATGLDLVSLPDHLMVKTTPGLTVLQLQASISKAMVKYPDLGLVVVDYLQLMDGEGESQNIRIGNISTGLKRLALKFKVPVLALSQLNREVEKRQDKKPKLSDLRDSGAIEQDADNVLLLHRETDPTKDTSEAEIFVGKNRFGEIRLIPMRFKGQESRFEEVNYGS